MNSTTQAAPCTIKLERLKGQRFCRSVHVATQQIGRELGVSGYLIEKKLRGLMANGEVVKGTHGYDLDEIISKIKEKGIKAARKGPCQLNHKPFNTFEKHFWRPSNISKKRNGERTVNGEATMDMEAIPGNELCTPKKIWKEPVKSGEKPADSFEDKFISLIKDCTKPTHSGKEFDSRMFRQALLKFTTEKPYSIESIQTVVAQWKDLLENGGNGCEGNAKQNMPVDYMSGAVNVVERFFG